MIAFKKQWNFQEKKYSLCLFKYSLLYKVYLCFYIAVLLEH